MKSYLRPLAVALSLVILIGCGNRSYGSTATLEPEAEAEAGPETPEELAEAVVDALVRQEDRDAETRTFDQAAVRPLPPMEPWPVDPVRPAPKMPKVDLSQESVSTCKVLVGDPMPLTPLLDLAGNSVTLKDHLGAKCSVVFFWNGRSKRSLEQLAFIRQDLGKPEETGGIAIIGINTGDTAEAASKQIDKHVDEGDKLVNMLDPDGAFFAAVATEKLPRTYVLDAKGRIRWLDVEYTARTQRCLTEAVRTMLTEQ